MTASPSRVFSSGAPRPSIPIHPHPSPSASIRIPAAAFTARPSSLVWPRAARISWAASLEPASVAGATRKSAPGERSPRQAGRPASEAGALARLGAGRATCAEAPPGPEPRPRRRPLRGFAPPRHEAQLLAATEGLQPQLLVSEGVAPRPRRFRSPSGRASALSGGAAERMEGDPPRRRSGSALARKEEAPGPTPTCPLWPLPSPGPSPT